MKILYLAYLLSVGKPANDSLLFKKFNQINMLIDSASKTSNTDLQVEAVNQFNKSYDALLELCKSSTKKWPKVSLATIKMAITAAQKLRYVGGVIKLNEEAVRLWPLKGNKTSCKDCKHHHQH